MGKRERGAGQPPVPAVIRVEPPGMRFRYSNPAYPKIQVTAREGCLFWAGREMQAVAAGGFVVAEAGIEVQFVRDASGTVIAAEYRSPGMRKMKVRRTR